MMLIRVCEREGGAVLRFNRPPTTNHHRPTTTRPRPRPKVRTEGVGPPGDVGPEWGPRLGAQLPCPAVDAAGRGAGYWFGCCWFCVVGMKKTDTGIYAYMHVKYVYK